MSGISRIDVSGRSSQDVYIMLLPDEERAKMELSDDQKKLPHFTANEIQAFLKSFALQRLLLMAGLRSMGKSDIDMAQYTKDLQKMQDWIDGIQKGITLAQGAKANKDSKIDWDQIPGFRKKITEMALWAKKKGITIDIDLERVTGGSIGRLKEEPDIVIGQLQNISSTINSEIKNTTTKVQQSQADRNTKVENYSSIMKSFDELGKSISRSVS